MLRGVLWNLQMYFRLLSVQIRSQMQYRASFWMDLLSTAIGNGIAFLSISLIMQRFHSVAGWTLGEVALLIGMVEMSFGTMDMVFSGFDYDYFALVVREGRFDQVMLRPVGLTWQVLGSRFLLRRLGRVLGGLIIFLVAVSLANIHWTLWKVLYLPVVFVSQVLVLGGLFIVGSTLTFWTLQSIEAVNILTYGGGDTMSYPMQIYPAWMRHFFTYLIPFIFLNYYPALFFLDKPDPLHFPWFAPFMAPFVALAFFVATLAFWRVGINHYQSAGT